MLTFDKFSGINNVQPEPRLDDSALVIARDVDIGLSGEVYRRAGFSALSPDCHKNLYQAQGYMLATIGGDLVAIDEHGARTVVADAVGADRIWYCRLPGGSTAFSNGLIHGVTDGASGREWSVPVPGWTGDAEPIAGALHSGAYAWHLTYTRLSDGLEGPPSSAAPVTVESGGVFLYGLPAKDGHKLNVYLSGHNGEGAYLAGSTAGDEFAFSGSNDALVLPCRTMGLSPAPIGTVSAFWRGRVLVAQGPVLWASMPHAPHLFDMRRDFKQFDAPITLVQPVDDGVYVGTERELAFLAGDLFDQMAYRSTAQGAVALGSGVAAPGDMVQQGDGVGSGTAMLCIAGGGVVAGFSGGTAINMTEGRYRCTAAEVSATFRIVNGVPQYLAVPQ